MTEVMEDGALLPRLSRVRNMTHLVAAQIVEAAQRAGLCAQVCARVGGAGEVSVCVEHPGEWVQGVPPISNSIRWV